MRTITFSGDSFESISKQFDQISSSGFQASLVILFSSVSQEFNKIAQLFTDQGIQVFGASSAGEIQEDQALEFSVAGMLFEIDPSYFDIYKAKRGNKTTWQISAEAANHACNKFENPSFIVLSGGLTTDGEEIINGIKEVAGSDVSLYGALAADDFLMESSWVFSNDWQSDDGILVLIFNQEKVIIEGLAVHGWQSVGVAKTITHSEGNVVYTIDDVPALDVFIKYFGLPDTIDAKKQAASMLGAQYPLQILKEDDSTVMRAPMSGNNEDGSLIFAGGVPQGSKVKFSIPPGFDIIEKVIEEVQELKEEVPQADALIMFSCKARHLALGPMVEEEIAGIRKKWQVPMVGFFAYGEIGKPQNSTCDFHNESCSLVVIREA